jgi:CheY-like chemotaxis protein
MVWRAFGKRINGPPGGGPKGRYVSMALAVCPGCGFAETRPSLRRGVGEYLLACLLIAPYRCRRCRVRFFHFSLVHQNGLVEDGLNLNGSSEFPPEPVPPAHQTAPPDEVPVAHPAPILVDGQPTILILDENPPIRKLLRRFLERNGYHTNEIAQFRDLRAELQFTQVDLLILDLDRLPREVQEAIVALEGTGCVPKIIAFSAEPAAANGVSSSMVVLPKPLSTDALLENVRRALNRSEGAHA